MGDHKELYKSAVSAVRSGLLKEPFSAADVQKACPGYAVHTYGVFLPKHRKGNPGGNTELFEQIGRGLYRILSRNDINGKGVDR